MAKKKRLGRGLDALLSGSLTNTATEHDTTPDTASPELQTSGAFNDLLKELPIEFLQSGRYQPRRHMDETALNELADSLKAQGMMQPIVVRPLAENDRYEIIAGERRWRAAQIAQLEKVPCLVRDVNDEAAIAMALIENIQRENLNAMEEAIALQRLATEFELTHQQVATAVGKSRTTISNLLRLMKLEPAVRDLLENGDIELGHAKVLLALSGDSQVQAANTTVANAFTVRQTEQHVHNVQNNSEPKSARVKKIDPNITALQNTLEDLLSASVHIKDNGKGKGKLVISYNSLDELDGILAHIK